MKQTILTILAFATVLTANSKTFTLTSIDKELTAEIQVDKQLSFNLRDTKQQIVSRAEIAMQTTIGTWGVQGKVLSAEKKEVHGQIASPFYKKSKVADDYRMLKLRFKGFSIEFRMYDEGLAYRFISNTKRAFNVIDETETIMLPEDFTAWIPYAPSRTKKDETTLEEQLWTDHQSQYACMKISDAVKDKLMINPFVVNLNNGEKLCIAESDINDYPGMYLTVPSSSPLPTSPRRGGESSKFQVPSSKCELHSKFAAYPVETEDGGHGNVERLVKKRADYIARVEGERTFPWRIFIVAENECRLPESDMVYRLASENKIGDTSWIRPGKTAWDWWNNSTLFGIDFKAGFNTETYKYFIDFAARYHLEYILIDEGWFDRKTTNIFDVVQDLDLKAILAYAKAKGVGVWLWTGFLSLDRDLERAASHYAAMGVKGFKIDFFDRDDQWMMAEMWRMADVCAKNKLMIDFHGCSKPSGLQRTYPNVLNYEAVFGLEQLRWSKPELDMVAHDVTLPFTRMVAGPMDYTPGAMRNSVKGMYYPNKKNPMSQGTRAHQVATYVVFDSPFNMLADSPSLYIKEDATTRFISQIPTVFDETKVLDGKIGEYVVIARRKGDTWYIGAMNNWKSRKINIDLPSEMKTLHIFADGINAKTVAEDYSISTKENVKTITITLAPGGGWVGIGK